MYKFILEIGNTKFNKESESWSFSPQIIQRIQEMDCAYNSLKYFDSTHKDFDDYIKKKEEEIIEHNKLSNTYK